MALDWKQEINLSTITGLFKRGKGASAGSSALPTKTTMNLYQGDPKTTDIRKVVIVGVLLFAFIALFVKFGVLDQLARLSQKQGELAEQRMITESSKAAAMDYDEIKEVYDAYQARYGGSRVDAIAVLDMVEQLVMPAAQVTSIVFSDSTLTLTLYDVPLDTVGNIAKTLEGQSMVSAVNVTTASTHNAEGMNTVSTLVVTLNTSGSEAQ